MKLGFSQDLIKPTDGLNVEYISIQHNIPVSLRQAATIPGHHRVTELVQSRDLPLIPLGTPVGSASHQHSG